MKKLLSILTIAIIGVGIIAVPTYAMTMSDDHIFIRKDEVIDDDFFAAGDEIVIEGTVNGDVYAAGNRVVIRGTVNGDVIAGASSIEVSGTIRDDLRGGANTTSLIGATIGDSISVAGNELSVDRDSVINGGIIFGGRLLSLDGSVGRGVMAATDTTRIDGMIGLYAKISATTITIDQDANIKGNFEYQSDNDAIITGTIAGETIRTEGADYNVDTSKVMHWLVVGFTAWAFAGALIIGGLFVLIEPRLLKNAHNNLSKKPWRILGRGTIVTLAVLPTIVLLMITLVGIPLAIILTATWMLALYFAKFFVAYSVGAIIMQALTKKLPAHKPKMFIALCIGLTLYYLLRLVPAFGFMVRFLTTAIGLGMMLSLYHRQKSVKQTVK